MKAKNLMAIGVIGLMVVGGFAGFVASAENPDPSEKHNLIPPLSSKLNTLYFHERWDAAGEGLVTFAGAWMNTAKGGKDPDDSASSGGTALTGPPGTEKSTVYDLSPIVTGKLILDTSKDIEATIVLATNTGVDPTTQGCKVTVILTAGSTEIGSASQSQVTVPSGATYDIKFKPSVGLIELSESNNLVCEVRVSQTGMPTGSQSPDIHTWKLVLPIIDGPGDHIAAPGAEKIALTPDADTKEGKPGSDVVFTITAINGGTKEFKLAPSASTSRPDWIATVSPAELSLAANGGNATFTVSIHIPSNASMGDSATVDVFGAKDPIVLTVKAGTGEGAKGKTPGFELFALIGAVGVAAVLLRRKH